MQGRARAKRGRGLRSNVAIGDCIWHEKHPALASFFLGNTFLGQLSMFFVVKNEISVRVLL